jgi:cytochrome c oxidase subunit 2
MNVPLYPERASTSAGQIDALYFVLTGVTLFFLLLVFVPMTVFLFKYRMGHHANRQPLNLPTLKIELAWTIVPLVIALGLFGWSGWVYYDLQSPPQDAIEINVIGKQWMWKIQHQEGRREINELHVPVGRPIKITLASEDVIHSFFIPAFRVKQDAVPGRFTSMWFQPTRVGDYHLFCAEYCGAEHSRMIGRVRVVEPADFQEWLARGDGASVPLQQSGARLFRELGCSGCHVGNSVVRAPPLEGLHGKMVPLASGDFVVADDRYLRDSILLPNLEITAGYEPLMPTYQGKVTEEHILELIAYIKAIGNLQPGQAKP